MQVVKVGSNTQGEMPQTKAQTHLGVDISPLQAQHKLELEGGKVTRAFWVAAHKDPTLHFAPPPTTPPLKQTA